MTADDLTDPIREALKRASEYRERAAECRRQAKQFDVVAAEAAPEVIDFELANGKVVLQEAGNAEASITIDDQNVFDPVEVNEFR